MKNTVKPSFQTRNEAQRSERFGTPLRRQPVERVERKRGSKSLVPLRYTRVWNDGFVGMLTFPGQSCAFAGITGMERHMNQKDSNWRYRRGKIDLDHRRKCWCPAICNVLGAVGDLQ